MKILYISTACSQAKYQELYNIYQDGLRPSIQNFHYAIINGLAKNGNDVTALSGYQIPISKGKKVFGAGKETENNIKFVYPFMLNYRFIRKFLILFFFIMYLIWWILKNVFSKKRIIIDSSFVSVAPLMVLIANIFSVHILGIVADVYDYMSLDVESNEKSIVRKISGYINNYCWRNYDSFVFLTEKMNELLNVNNKPYIVMEGIYSNIKTKNINENKGKKKIIMYSGSIARQYGIEALIKAFKKIKSSDVLLHLYGHTDMADYLAKAQKDDKRITYFGTLPISEIRKKEQEAYILVNPRPTEDEYTKYSFPSKTLEYMATGNIFITTKLSGIPREYDEYINYFNDETIDGMSRDLMFLLDDKNKEKLKKKAKKAKEFILNNKNEKVQTKKISDFVGQSNDSRNEGLVLMEKISIIILTLTSILPNFSNRILFGVALIMWGISVFPILHRTKYKLIEKHKLFFGSLLLLLIVFLINFICGRMVYLMHYIFSYIRILTILLIAVFYSSNKECYKKNIKILFIVSMLVVFYSSLKTGIYNTRYYNISRIISTGYDMKWLTQVGFGSYEYIYGIVFFIFVLLAFLVKSIKKRQFTLTTFNIFLVFAASIFCILKAEFMYSFILLFIAIILYIFKINSLKKIVICFLSIIAIIFVIRMPLSKLLNTVAENINKPNISMRLNDISKMLTGDIENTIDIKARLNNYSTSIETFSKNPIVGVGFNEKDDRIGLHSTFLDVFAKYGIIGGVLFLTVILSSLYNVFKSLKEKSKELFFYCIVTFLVFMLINNALLVTIFYFVYIIVPIILTYMEDNYESIMDC